MSCRSKSKGWLLPNDIVFNWPVSSAVPKPREIKKPQQCKAKATKVQKRTFLCEKYDSVFLRRFLKKSGSRYEAKHERELRNVSPSPPPPFVSVVRHKPLRRCGMKPRRSLPCRPPKVDKPGVVLNKVRVSLNIKCP